MPTTTVLDLAGLLADAEAATAELRRSAGVPTAVEAFVERLADVLHAAAPGSLGADPYLTSSLYAGALRALRAVHHDDPGRRAELQVALEQVRQATRDALQGAPLADEAPVRPVLRELVAVMRVSQAEVAGLLGVSTRQLQRWLAEDGPVPSGPDEARVRAIARIAAQLRPVLSGPGVAAWFTRPHPELGAAPVTLVGDPLAVPRLVALASALRAQAG